MKLITLASCAGVAVAGRLTERALSFARDVENEYTFGLRSTAYEKRDWQEPLDIQTEYDATATRHWAKLEIESASFLNLIPFYWTNIALGTPNQPFRMILDLGYGGAVVRSDQCLDHSCERGFNYSRKASSTFHDERERFLLHLPAQFAYGNVSRDHMQLVALNITDVMFGAVDDFHGENFLYMAMAYHAEGALGLAPPVPSAPVYTEREVANFLHTVIDQGILESNTMTLDLPYDQTSRGSLTLGILPKEAQQGNEIRLPISRGTAVAVKNKWQFNIDGIAVTGHNSTHISPIKDYGTFELGSGYSFPKNMTRDVLTALNAREGSFVYPEVHCSRWDDMPEIVFTLAGHDIVLERDDYAIRGYSPSGEVCAVLITENWFDEEPISLGVEFMRKFYVTFDMDDDLIRLFHRATN